MTDYAGIDYGMGGSNIDGKTGIRFGVIHQNNVSADYWFESSEPVYFYLCTECKAELGNELPEKCPTCGHEFSDFDYYDGLDPMAYVLDDGEYKAECGTDDGDIFVTKSPYFTYAQFCSPCAPGAVYLMNPFKGSKEEAEAAGFARGYCFGHDWFDTGKAPYPVYSVETGELVNSE